MWETLETETEFSSIFTFPKVKIVKAYLDIWDRRQVYYILARSSCRREHTPSIFSCLNLKKNIYYCPPYFYTPLFVVAFSDAGGNSDAFVWICLCTVFVYIRYLSGIFYIRKQETDHPLSLGIVSSNNLHTRTQKNLVVFSRASVSSTTEIARFIERLTDLARVSHFIRGGMGLAMKADM